MALTGFMIPMKVIMMLKMWMPAPDMYIINAFIAIVLPGDDAISKALCQGVQRETHKKTVRKQGGASR